MQKLTKFGQRSEKAKMLIKHLYSFPSLNINQIAEVLETSHQTASVMAKKFEELGILKEITGYKRNKYYSFYKYINLF